MNKDLTHYPWWSYLEKDQQILLSQSFELLEKEKKNEIKGVRDYSFIVFPAAKAYEGFLKKLFYDTGLISKNDYRDERFRIGRALNPSLSRNHWAGSVYERLKSFCGGEALPFGLWQAWKKGRNLLFHYFKGDKNMIAIDEAEKRLMMIQKAIGAGFNQCRPEKEKKVLEGKRRLALRRIFWFYSFLLIVWGFYRYLFRLPEAVEELVLKPLIWLGPTFFIVKFLEKRSIFSSLGLIKKNIIRNLYLGILVGMGFAATGLLLNFFKYGKFNFVAIGNNDFLLAFVLSAITAFSEEIVFRGYLLNRLFEVLRDEWWALLVSAAAFALIHLPITVFVLHYSPVQIYVYGVLAFFYSLGSGILFLRTGTVWPSILAHIFWSWPIILFR